MSIAYFDCFSGVAGDMILGSLIDAGLPSSYLKSGIKKTGLEGYEISAKRGRNGILGGIDLKIRVFSSGHGKKYSEIKKIIEKSGLSAFVKEKSLEIFLCLALAEAHVHGKKVDDVHFHEVGAVDSIVDIVGSVLGLEYFGFDAIYSSPLPISRGYVKCAHGTLPVPAPAALELIRGIPVISLPVDGEIVTPTGISILKTVSKGFGNCPLRKINKVGYGLGDNKIPGMSNALRLMIGEGEPLTVIETNIDDMNPEVYPYLVEKLLGSGAIDVGLIPMVMKKGRPGMLIQLLCEGKNRKQLIKKILQESTTLGVRYFPVEREITEREVKKVKTKWGVIRVKIAKYDGQTTTISPEHGDCRKIAEKKKVPLKEVYRQAIINSHAY